jgi:hypothetical protein
MQIASACVLLLTISQTVSAATTTSGTTPPAVAQDAPQLHLLDLDSDVTNLVLEDDNSGTIDFVTNSAPSSGGELASLRLTRAMPSRQLIEESPTLDVRSSPTGDFIVPIPAIGAGWILLMGAGMYKVGCRVLRVKN